MKPFLILTFFRVLDLVGSIFLHHLASNLFFYVPHFFQPHVCITGLKFEIPMFTFELEQGASCTFCWCSIGSDPTLSKHFCMNIWFTYGLSFFTFLLSFFYLICFHFLQDLFQFCLLQCLTTAMLQKGKDDKNILQTSFTFSQSFHWIESFNR